MGRVGQSIGNGSKIFYFPSKFYRLPELFLEKISKNLQGTSREAFRMIRISFWKLPLKYFAEFCQRIKKNSKNNCLFFYYIYME